MGNNHKYWKYEFEMSLKIQSSETSALVKAKVGELMLSVYNNTDVDILLKKLCRQEHQVSHNLYWVLFSFSKTNVLGLSIFLF
jgi:hypothetical protein